MSTFENQSSAPDQKSSPKIQHKSDEKVKVILTSNFHNNISQVKDYIF